MSVIRPSTVASQASPSATLVCANCHNNSVRPGIVEFATAMPLGRSVSVDEGTLRPPPRRRKNQHKTGVLVEREDWNANISDRKGEVDEALGGAADSAGVSICSGAAVSLRGVEDEGCSKAPLFTVGGSRSSGSSLVSMNGACQSLISPEKEIPATASVPKSTSEPSNFMHEDFVDATVRESENDDLLSQLPTSSPSSNISKLSMVTSPGQVQKAHSFSAKYYGYNTTDPTGSLRIPPERRKKRKKQAPSAPSHRRNSGASKEPLAGNGSRRGSFYDSPASRASQQAIGSIASGRRTSSADDLSRSIAVEMFQNQYWNEELALTSEPEWDSGNRHHSDTDSIDDAQGNSATNDDDDDDILISSEDDEFDEEAIEVRLNEEGNPNENGSLVGFYNTSGCNAASGSDDEAIDIDMSDLTVSAGAFDFRKSLDSATLAAALERYRTSSAEHSVQIRESGSAGRRWAHSAGWRGLRRVGLSAGSGLGQRQRHSSGMSANSTLSAGGSDLDRERISSVEYDSVDAMIGPKSPVSTDSARKNKSKLKASIAKLYPFSKGLTRGSSTGPCILQLPDPPPAILGPHEEHSVVLVPAHLFHPTALGRDVELEIRRNRHTPTEQTMYRSLDYEEYSSGTQGDVTSQQDKMDEQASKMLQIESLFPNDQLELASTEPVAAQPNGTHTAAASGGPGGLAAKKKMRRRSSVPSSGILKQLRGGGRSGLELSGLATVQPQDAPAVSGRGGSSDYVSRKFLFEGPALFTVGVQTQERYMFLFNDLIFIAKQRTPRSFKLKHRVTLSDLWLADSSVDVCERATTHPERSFVVGWPTTNFLVTFNSKEECLNWKEKLRDQIMEEKDGLSDSLMLIVLYKNSQDQTTRKVSVGKEEEVRAVMMKALRLFNISDERVGEFQLWVQSSREDAAYPLFGHELPYAIQACHEREAKQDGSIKCEFYLTERNKKHIKIDPRKKPKKRQLNFMNRLRRPSGKPTFSSSSAQIPLSVPPSQSAHASGYFFGRSPQDLCIENGGDLPPVLKELLELCYHRTAYLPEVFRKNCLERLRKQVYSKLDSEEPTGWASTEDGDPLHGFVYATMLKQFLRELPESLLGHDIKVWMSAFTGDEHEKMQSIRNLLGRLPGDQLHLLRPVLAVLRAVRENHSVTLMSSSNLGVVLGPSLLWPRGEDPQASASHLSSTSEKTAFCNTATKQSPMIVSFLVEHALDLMGSNLVEDCFGGPPDSSVGDTPLDIGGRKRRRCEDESIPIGICEGAVSEDSGSEGHHGDPGPERSSPPGGMTLNLPGVHQHHHLAGDNGYVLVNGKELGNGEERGLMLSHGGDDYPESLESLSEHEPPPSRTLTQMSPSSLSRDSGLMLSENQEEEGQSDESRGADKRESAGGEQGKPGRRQYRQRRASRPVPSRRPEGSSHEGSDELLNESVVASSSYPGHSVVSPPGISCSTASLPAAVLGSKSRSCHSLVSAQNSDPSSVGDMSTAPAAFRRSGGKSGVGGSALEVNRPEAPPTYLRPTSLDPHMHTTSEVALGNIGVDEDDDEQSHSLGRGRSIDPTLLTKSASGVHLEWSKDMDSRTASSKRVLGSAGGGGGGGVERLQKKLVRLASIYQEIEEENGKESTFGGHTNGGNIPAGAYSSGGDSSSPSDTEPPVTSMNVPFAGGRVRRNSNPGTPNELDKAVKGNHFSFDIPPPSSTSGLAIDCTSKPPPPYIKDSYDRMTIRHLTPISSSSSLIHHQQEGATTIPSSHPSSKASRTRPKSSTYSELLPSKDYSLAAAPPFSPVSSPASSSTSSPQHGVIKRIVTTTTNKPGSPALSKTVTTIIKPTNSSAIVPPPTHFKNPPPAFQKSRSVADFSPSLSSSISSTARPHQPPNYTEALSRQQALGSPVLGKSEEKKQPSEAEKIRQTLASRLAKNMYESSQRTYEKQQKSGVSSPRKESQSVDREPRASRELRASRNGADQEEVRSTRPGRRDMAANISSSQRGLSADRLTQPVSNRGRTEKVSDRLPMIRIQRSRSQTSVAAPLSLPQSPPPLPSKKNVAALVAGFNNNNNNKPNSQAAGITSDRSLPRSNNQRIVVKRAVGVTSGHSTSSSQTSAVGTPSIFFQPSRTSENSSVGNGSTTTSGSSNKGRGLFYRPENPPSYDEALYRSGGKPSSGDIIDASLESIV